MAPDPAAALVPYASPAETARYRRAVVGVVALFAFAAAVSLHVGAPFAALATFMFGACALPFAHVTHVGRARPYAPDMRRALSLLLTAVALVAVAALIEVAFSLDRRTAGGAVAVALVEVALQVAVLAWLVRRGLPRFRFDGVVVGATVGMGFALGQSSLFALAFADRPAELLAVLGAQTFLGPLAHGAVAALVGAAIGRTRAYEPVLNGKTLWALGLAIPLRILWDMPPAEVWSRQWSVAVVCAALVLLRLSVRCGVSAAQQRSVCRRLQISPLRAPAMPGTPR